MKKSSAKTSRSADAAFVRKRAPRTQKTPVPVVLARWEKVTQPDGNFILRPGKPIVEDEINTREAAKILGLSMRHINTLCDEGVLEEGRDWWRTPGNRRPGDYHIKRVAVLRLRQGR